MRFRPLPPEFLEEMRATEKREADKREAVFEAERKRKLEKERLRIAGLLAEREIHKHKHEYQKEVLGTDSLEEKLHGEGSKAFYRKQKLGRYTVISDGAMLVNAEKSFRATEHPVIRVRCVCGHTSYIKASYARKQMKQDVDGEWGCNSKKCLNQWREKRKAGKL
jgi:hypothetical protein